MSGRLVLVLAAAVAAAVAIPSAPFAQDDPPPHVAGTVHGTGTHFEVTDSDSLNVTVDTTDSVTVWLDSVGELVNLHIVGVEGVTATQVTIRGLPPNSTFHRYLDRFENHTVVETGDAGVDPFTIDLSVERHVILKRRPSTIFLTESGWSQPVGTWDRVTRVATLTQDVTETIQIGVSNVVLDGGNHSVAPTKDSYGVFIPDKTYERITIQNLTIDGPVYGIYSDGGQRLVIRSNVIRSSAVGMRIRRGYECRVLSNTLVPAAGRRMKYAAEWIGMQRSTFGLNSVAGGVDAAFLGAECAYDTVWHNTVDIDGSPFTLSKSTAMLVFRNSFSSSLGRPPVASGCTACAYNRPRPVGGNYWNVWSTPDADGDGFVDKAFKFDGGIDELPLTTPVPPTYTITATSGSGGSIEPAGAVEVAPGSSITFRFLPEPCYRRDLLQVDGEQFGAKESYTFTNVLSSHTISVSFAGHATVPAVAILGPPGGALLAVGVPVSFSGAFWDEFDESHTATWYLDDATIPAGDVVVDEVQQTVAATHVFTAPGVYSIRLVVTDQCGLAGEAGQVNGVDAMIVVYDPNAGFVTGGGWIDSPPGAYLADPAIGGRVNFGFVSKYQRGVVIPTGETEVQLHAGNLDFHSTAYEWLVAGGCMAQYAGSGMLNGQAGYGFVLTTLDGDLKSPRQPDRFRLRIWDPAGEDVYDNMPGMADDVVPTTLLGGGSVVIHTGTTFQRDIEPLDRRPAAPREFALLPASPSPFRHGTRLTFDVPSPSRVRLTVFDIAGREVATLADGLFDPGRFDRDWSGDGGPGAAEAGVYFVRLEARAVGGDGGILAVRKVVRIR